MIHAEARTTPRQRRRQATLQRIQQEAMAIVVERGLDGLTMAELAGRLDYTPGALYRYYAGKDAVIAALVTDVIRTIGGSVQASVADIPADQPLGRLQAIGAAYRTIALDEPGRFALIALLLASPQVQLTRPEDVRPAMAALFEALAVLVQTLDAAVDQGALAPGDAHERALLLFAGLQGALQLRKQQIHAPHLIDIEVLSDQMVRSLLLGWGADPARLTSRSAP